MMKCIEQIIDSKVGLRLDDADIAVEWITNAGFPLIESQPFMIALLKLIKSCYWESVNEN